MLFRSAKGVGGGEVGALVLWGKGMPLSWRESSDRPSSGRVGGDGALWLLLAGGTAGGAVRNGGAGLALGGGAGAGEEGGATGAFSIGALAWNAAAWS